MRYSNLVCRAALEKAQSVAAPGDSLLLGADTIVVCNGDVLGKPADTAHARRMLKRLSDQWHRVYTGIALVSGRRYIVGYECTKVRFRPLSNREIQWYVATGEPMDKAGAYAIQGQGAGFVRAVCGCYTNVIGLPLPRLMEMLGAFERDSPGRRGSRRGVC